MGAVILTIGGMLAGLGLGVLRAWLQWSDPFVQIAQVVSGGVVGTLMGLGLAILLAAHERGTFRSVKKTMLFIAAAAVVVWASFTLLRVLFPAR